MPREPDEIIARSLVRIRRDQQARHLQRRAGQADTARFQYLDALDEAGGPLPISKIAERIGVDRPRASRLTADLTADGSIERTPRPGDTRYTDIQLTPHGRTVITAIHDNRRRAVTEALAGFTPQESQTLADLLERFVDGWPR